MDTPPRLSNARDYEIATGRLCPHCGNDRLDMIKAIRVGFRCDVCSKTWPALPEQYRACPR